MASSSTRNSKTTPSHSHSPPSRLSFPFPFSAFDPKPLSLPPPDAASSLPPSPGGFPSSVKISRMANGPHGGSAPGPAFVGQVFSMCDLSGTGLMAVSNHFEIPFISERTPEWLKKMFATITRSERKGPVFRFFLDLGDAVSYVKRLNIPSGVVGACRLDLAYDHFKEKPHLFQFVPNEKQVKEANKLLKAMPRNDGLKKVQGVPVFSAQNLDIAIATMDGIKWYTPYFFDKGMLDNILDESVDQHFHSLIQTRHVQRRRDVIDDNLAAEVIEEMGDNLWEPPEVQEVMDEMGNPGIPMSVITKAAEIQLLYAVDKVLLGNRWLRKATGIQPKYPYMVDSFEKRTAASVLRAAEIQNQEMGILGASDPESKKVVKSQPNRRTIPDLRLAFEDWLGFGSTQDSQNEQEKQPPPPPSPFLPKITMVGISTAESGRLSKASLKQTMDDLTKELERIDQENPNGRNSLMAQYDNVRPEERDPLFVANVGDYYSGLAKSGSARWVRGRNDN